MKPTDIITTKSGLTATLALVGLGHQVAAASDPRL